MRCRSRAERAGPKTRRIFDAYIDRGGNFIDTANAYTNGSSYRPSTAESGRRPAQIALAWTLLNSGVAATLLGARTLKQLEDNLGALDVSFGDAQRARLEQVSAITLGFPHDLLRLPVITQAISGGTAIPARTW